LSAAKFRVASLTLAPWAPQQQKSNITTIHTNIHYCLPEGAKESTPAVAVVGSITKT